MSPRTPWLDRTLGDRIGALLVWLGKRAIRRGDRHEFNHLLAAVLVGNSDHCAPENCTLSIDEPDQHEPEPDTELVSNERRGATP